MEKFSAYRVEWLDFWWIYCFTQKIFQDPGTGIQVCLTDHFQPITQYIIQQPFLTPVPPIGSDFLAKATLPLRLIFGAVRTALLLLLVPVYIVLVPGLCTIFVSFLKYT